ncbi:MAG TPA: ATP-binding protein [Longimicrobium sp.]|nr:ATP-binding protein [Longimicrobium sp.]
MEHRSAPDARLERGAGPSAYPGGACQRSGRSDARGDAAHRSCRGAVRTAHRRSIPSPAGRTPHPLRRTAHSARRPPGGYDAVFRSASPAARAAETFRSVFDGASAGILVLSVDWVVLDANLAAARLFGCARAALVGCTFDAIVPGRGQETLRARGLAGGGPARLLHHIRVPGQRSRVVELTLTPGSYFGLSAVLVFAYDVTRRYSRGDELGRVRARLHALLLALPMPAVFLDRDGGITSFNPAAAQLLEGTGEELQGRPLPLARHPGGDEWLRRALAGESLAGVQAALRGPDDSAVGVSIFSAALKDPDGGAEGCLLLLARQPDPERLDELERAQRLSALGALASRVAHDFNNILTVVAGETDLLALEMHEHGAAPSEELQGIRDATARAGELTRQLLAFGRGGMGHRRVLDVNEAVREVSRMLRRLVGEDVELVVLTDAEMPYVSIAPGELDQLLVNLAVNARDAMENGGQLVVQTLNLPGRTGPRADGDPERWTAVRVADTGRGMDPDLLRRVFDPFFTTRPDDGGTGVGLWTVERIVRDAGGHVRVRSEPGEGTEMTILLPGAESPAEHEPEPHLDGMLYASAGALPRTVLVAEDNPALRRVIRHALERAGIEAVIAPDGEAALQEWERRSGTVDLVVTDVVMPKMGGREVVARVRAERPDCPVLLISGYEDPREWAEAAGLTVLQKPFGVAGFIRAVAAALHPPGAGAGPEIRAEPCTAP